MKVMKVMEVDSLLKRREFEPEIMTTKVPRFAIFLESLAKRASYVVAWWLKMSFHVQIHVIRSQSIGKEIRKFLSSIRD